jgi:hypothetical protein
VGPRRGKSHHNHTRARSKADRDEHHKEHGGNPGYEEVVVIIKDYANKEVSKTSITGTPPRASNADDRTVGGK